MCIPNSIIHFLVELMMYIGVFAVGAQVFTNLGERHMMESELTTLKSGLYSLGKKINNMEMAYDTLREEIKKIALSKTQEKTSRNEDPSSVIEVTQATDINKYTTKIDGLFSNLADADINTEKETKDFMQNFERSKEDFSQDSITVPTEYKSTETESGIDKYTAGLDTFDESKCDGCKCEQKLKPLPLCCSCSVAAESVAINPTPQVSDEQSKCECVF